MHIKVTAKDVARIALDAYQAGRLTAQTKGVVYRCAIGQCFTEKEAYELQHGDNGDYPLAFELLRRGIIEAPADDYDAIETLERFRDTGEIVW